MNARIVIVAEDTPRRADLLGLLHGDGFSVAAFSGWKEAQAAFREVSCDLLVVDARRAGSGPLGRQVSETTVLLLADESGDPHAEVPAGIFEVLGVPIRAESARLTLQRALDRQGLRRRLGILQREAQDRAENRPIVASSPEMIRLLEVMERAAEYKSPLLLAGEPGSGLEVLARAVHAQSARRAEPFATLTCAGRSESDLQQALFGRRESSPTAGFGEARGLLRAAQGGSVFLDEIWSLTDSQQRELLRLLRDEEIVAAGFAKPLAVDVRLIAGTSRDLAAEREAGRFDGDLFRMLDAVRLAVPPLRDRAGDVPLLVDHYLARARARYGKPALRITDDALERLVAYDWPGNVRELEIVVERAALLAAGDHITARDLSDGLYARHERRTTGSGTRLGLRAARKSLESDMIRQALKATEGNRTHAARLLEISHRALLYKIKEYGIRD